MRHGKGTIKEARTLVEAMRRGEVPAFHVDRFGLQDFAAIQDMINKAKRHHTIQERHCSEEMSEATERRCAAVEAGLERDISAIASRYGLRAHFDGDPRGFTVKLHAPKGDVFNTWGGAETGYGIGEK